MSNDFFKKTNNALHWTPEECLNDALEMYQKKEPMPYAGKKCIIIALNDKDNNDCGSWSFSQSGMNVPELVSLLERVKTRLCIEYL